MLANLLTKFGGETNQLDAKHFQDAMDIIKVRITSHFLFFLADLIQYVLQKDARRPSYLPGLPRNAAQTAGLASRGKRKANE